MSTNIYPPKEAAIENFVEGIFTNGSGQKAERLVLWRDSDDKNLGGWSRYAIKERLRDFLNVEPNEQLSSCPFCDCREIYRGYLVDSPQRYYRECQNCLASVKGYDTAEEADAAWNRRGAYNPST